MLKEEISQQLWYHGTLNNYEKFSEKMYEPSNDPNAGLGIFLANDINVAKRYSKDNGYILVVEIKDSCNCYYASSEEFWNTTHTIENEDFDSMGELLIYPGEKMRKELVSKGYDVLFYHDPNEMGDVLVILNNDIANIIERIPSNLLNKETNNTTKIKFKHS